MDLPSLELECVNEEEWQVIDTNWWHTSYWLVSWEYIHNEKTVSTSEKPPPCFPTLPLTLFCLPDLSPPHENSDSYTNEVELALNTSLCGVQSAVEVVTSYEALVGIFTFDAANESLSLPQCRRDIASVVVEDDLVLTKELWDKMVDDFFFTPSEPISEAFDVTLSGDSSQPSSPSHLHRSLSTFSDLDFTDSDLSSNSISRPATPTRKMIDNMIVHFGDPSPVKGTPNSRPLNAFASSFVPSLLASKLDFLHDSSFTRPEMSDFTHPGPVAPSTTSIKLKKDDQGFYTKEDNESPSQKEFLPSFLQRPVPRRRVPASKTRAIVDHFRSTQGGSGEQSWSNESHFQSPNHSIYDQSLPEGCASASVSRRNQSRNSSPSFGLNEDTAGSRNVNPGTRAGQTRNLFLAFTRRRSGPSSPTQASSNGNSKEVGISAMPLIPSIAQVSKGEQIDGVTSSTKTGALLVVNEQPIDHSRPSSSKRRSSQAASQDMMPVPLVLPPASNRPLFPQHNTPFVEAASTSPLAPQFSANTSTPVPGVYNNLLSPIAYTSYLQHLQLQLLQQLQMRTVDHDHRSRTIETTSAPYTRDYFNIPKQTFTIPSMNMAPLMHLNSSTPFLRRDAVW